MTATMTAAREPGTGDCFEVAANLAWEWADNDTVRVCHGYVTRPGDGHRHIHAWVETSTEVPALPGWPSGMTITSAVDKSNGNDVTLIREAYYHFGGIVADEVRRYTLREASEAMLRTEHYGPWDEMTADVHGNQVAREGCDRCICGCKYWENDRCVDCGTTVTAVGSAGRPGSQQDAARLRNRD
jgi:hypothetical protein